MTTFVSLNGVRVPSDQPAIAPADRGFLLGEGAYETLRVVAGTPLVLDRHLRRMNGNLPDLGIPLKLTEAAIAGAIADTLEANGLVDARVRLTVTRGVSDDHPTVLIQALPYEPPPAAAYDPGVSVISVSDVPHPRMAVKTTSHAAYCQVDRRARAAGAYEGLFLEGDTWIEGSRTNLVARIGDTLLVSDSPWALPGISSEAVMAGAASQGLSVRRTALRPADLPTYDGLYLTNALIEVVPIHRVDGVTVASAGDAARRLRNAYRHSVGLPLV